jgi:chitinase
MTGRRLRTILAALLALGVAAWAASGATFSAFSSQTSNSSSFSAATDFVAPTVDTAVVGATLSGTTVGATGFVSGGATQARTYKVFANVSDTGNPASGVNTVTANVSSLTTGASTISLTFSSTGVTIGATTYHWISAEQTANSGLTGTGLTFSVTATDNASNSSGPVTSANTVNVDSNAPTAPTGLTIPADVGGNATGTATTGTDAGSGVAGLQLKYTTNGGATSTVIGICFSTGAASSSVSCTFDTHLLADGDWDFYSVTVDKAGNVSGLSNKKDVGVDNTAPTIGTLTITPAGTLSDTANVSTTASDSGSGLNPISYQVRQAGTTGSWIECATGTTGQVKVCTLSDASVIPVDDTNYDFRAVATDIAGNSSTTPTVTRFVDNTPFGVNIEPNTGGNTILGTGDSLTYTFSEPMATTSLLAGFTGASTAVTIRVDKAQHLTVFNSANTTQVNLGTVNTDKKFVDGGAPCIRMDFTGTMAMSGSVLTLSVTNNGVQGGGGSGCASGAQTGTKFVWTPSNSATDTSAKPMATTNVNESTTTDNDF